MSNNNQKLFDEFSAVSYDEWKEAAEKLLKGRPFDKVMKTKTPEGIVLDPIYMKDDIANLDHMNTPPGFPPYVRGTKAITNLDNPWLVAQQIYEPTPSEFSKSLQADLQRGQTALALKLDTNTLKGIDADSNSAENTGYRGVSVSTTDDVKTAFDGVIYSALPFHVNLGEDPLALTALIFAEAKKTNQLNDISGILAVDPLGYAASNGKLSVGLGDVYDHMADVVDYTKKQQINVKTILIEGHAYHNGGADSVTELAYVLNTLTEYIEAMQRRGLEINDIAGHIAISLSIGSNYFMEIAKIRAIKMLYANVIKAYGGDEDAQKIYLHAKTSSYNKTVYDPYVNMLRNASEAFSATVGVVDSLTVLPFDEPIRAADTFSRRISRNLQYLLIDEIHVNQPLDPAGGSWYIENLTSQVANEAWKKFQVFNDEGKMSELLKSGSPKQLVANKYEERFKDVAKRKKVYVGINQYANIIEKKLAKEDTDYAAVAKERATEVGGYKSKRSKQSKAITKAFADAITLENAIVAAKNGATLGELSSVVRAYSNGNYTAQAITFMRGAKRIEDMRDESAALKKAGNEIKVFSVNMGKLSTFKPRADFSRGFFEVGGFTVMPSDGFESPEDAAKAALESGANVAIICSSDKVYPDVVPQIAKAIKASNQNIKVMLAGRPPEDLKPIYDEAGVDDYIYLGSNNYAQLSKIQMEVKNA